MEGLKFGQFEEPPAPERRVEEVLAEKEAHAIESEFSRTREFEDFPSQEEQLPRTARDLQEAIKICDSFSPERKGFAPRVAFLADGDVIAHQEVDVSPLENGGYKVTFRIDPQNWETLRNSITSTKNYNPRASEVITYGDFIQFKADKVGMEGLDVLVATGKGAESYENIDSIGAQGMIEVIIPKESDGRATPTEEMAQKVGLIFKNYLQIPEGISPPSPEQERAYKRSLYAWHHKKLDGLTDDEWKAVESRLKRSEIFPACQEIVEEGKHLEYEKEGRLLLFHQLTGGGPIADILRYGLMSTEERSKRGIGRYGMSPSVDFHNGSGDRVFTTLYAEGVPNVENIEKLFGRGRVPGTRLAILDTALLDRVDWYAFLDDEYGTRVEPYFTENRVSPEKLIEAIRVKYHGNNEVSFRRGISASAIKHVLVGTTKEREDAIIELHSAGISEVNGRAIEDIIIVKDDFLDNAKDKS